MLVVNCLEMVNTGRYKCLIQIPGIAPISWPSKIGYLIVQGMCYVHWPRTKVDINFTEVF